MLLLLDSGLMVVDVVEEEEEEEEVEEEEDEGGRGGRAPLLAVDPLVRSPALGILLAMHCTRGRSCVCEEFGAFFLNYVTSECYQSGKIRTRYGYACVVDASSLCMLLRPHQHHSVLLLQVCYLVSFYLSAIYTFVYVQEILLALLLILFYVFFCVYLYSVLVWWMILPFFLLRNVSNFYLINKFQKNVLSIKTLVRSP